MRYIFFIFTMAGLLLVFAGIFWLIFSVDPEKEDGPELPEESRPISHDAR